MPIFEYRCKDCGFTFEKIVFGSSDFEIECPECHSENVTKLFSPFSTTGNTKSSAVTSCGSTGSGFS